MFFKRKCDLDFKLMFFCQQLPISLLLIKIDMNDKNVSSVIDKLNGRYFIEIASGKGDSDIVTYAYMSYISKIYCKMAAVSPQCENISNPNSMNCTKRTT